MRSDLRGWGGEMHVGGILVLRMCCGCAATGPTAAQEAKKKHALMGVPEGHALIQPPLRHKLCEHGAARKFRNIIPLHRNVVPRGCKAREKIERHELGQERHLCARVVLEDALHNRQRHPMPRIKIHRPNEPKVGLGGEGGVGGAWGSGGAQQGGQQGGRGGGLGEGGVEHNRANYEEDAEGGAKARASGGRWTVPHAF